MPSNQPPTDRPDGPATSRLLRRQFLALGAGASATVLAGCTSETDLPLDTGDSPTEGDGTDSATESGTFRLLISDQPVAIDAFDTLEVSFDRARIFRGEGVDAEETATEPAETTAATGTANETATATSTVDETATATETGSDVDAGAGDTDQQGVTVIDLDGATVDLTTVLGEKAMGVFEGELETGRYTKIELYAADVSGIVDGDPVEVTIPSGKLQIVKPFEVVAGETLSFVFDINVVEKGGTGEYNLLPVISESGIAGQDVEVDEIGSAAAVTEEAGNDADTNEDGTATHDDSSGSNPDGGPPDEAEDAS